jgi:hypothetical protein
MACVIISITTTAGDLILLKVLLMSPVMMSLWALVGKWVVYPCFSSLNTSTLVEILPPPAVAGTKYNPLIIYITRLCPTCTE